MKNRLFLLLGLAALFIYGFAAGHQVLVIAHRGGSHLAPENTLAAFRKAIVTGSDMIEIDVEQTRDSVVVVMHDTKVDRTTNGSGPVDSLDYDYIRTLDAGSWFDKRYEGENVPALDEVLDLIGGKVKLLIEIKDGSERYPGIERRTVKTIQKHNARPWVIVQSFNLKAIERVKAMDPGIRTFYLLGRNFNSYYNKIRKDLEEQTPSVFDYDGIAVHYSVLNAANVDTIKRSGLKVYTWTVNAPETMKTMIKAGVDGIITDAPDKLLELSKSKE